MWDGFWFLANQRAWQALPDDVRATVAKNINAAAVNERDDIRRLNNTLEVELKTKGLVFNDINPDAFRSALQKSGFYAEWKGRYGAEAWAILEKYTGKLG